MVFESLVDRIINTELNVRFVIVLDKDGNKVASKQRPDSENLLPQQELDKSLEHALNSWKFRSSMEKYLGKNEYVLAVYEKIRRFIIPVDDEHLMLVTLDNAGGQKDLIDRIMGILERDYTKPSSSGPQN